MTGKTLYNHWRDVPESEWRWPNFSPAEIACRGTGQLLLDADAMDALQSLRTSVGKPFIINSAYRSPEHNKRVKGARNSKHMQGIAFDISMANHDPQDFMAAARAHGFNGIGEYPTLGFTHIDTRANPTNWTGRDGKRWPVRTVNDRFAPEVMPTPKADAARKAGIVVAAAGAAENVLTELAAQSAFLPPDWVTWAVIGAACLALLRVVVPLIVTPQEDEQA